MIGSPTCRPFVRLLVAALLTTSLLGARDAAAQWAVGPRVGLDLVSDDLSVGAHAIIPFANLGPMAQVAVYPSIDAFVFGDATVLRTDLALVFPFRFEALPLSPYVGLGVGLVYETFDFREETRFDFDLLAGLAIETGTLVEPFLESRGWLFGTDSVGIVIGLHIYPTRDRDPQPPPDEAADDLEP